jgi:hypothetical protein
MFNELEDITINFVKRTFTPDHNFELQPNEWVEISYVNTLGETVVSHILENDNNNPLWVEVSRRISSGDLTIDETQ